MHARRQRVEQDCEYVGRIGVGDSITGDYLLSLLIDPTDPITFPRLSVFSPLYTKYKPRGIGLFFVPTTSYLTTGSQLPTITGAPIYDINQPIVADKEVLANQSGSTTAAAIKPQTLMIECDPKTMPYNEYFVTLPGETPEDPSRYTYCRVDILGGGATTAFDQANDLFICYDIELSETRVAPSLRTGLSCVAQFQNTTLLYPFYPASPLYLVNTLGLEIDILLAASFTLSYLLPANTTFLMVYMDSGVSTANVSCPVPTFSNGLAESKMFPNASGFQQTGVYRVPGSATTAAQRLGIWCFTYDGSGSTVAPPTVQFSTNAIPPGNDYAILFVTTISSLAAPLPTQSRFDPRFRHALARATKAHLRPAVTLDEKEMPSCVRPDGRVDLRSAPPAVRDWINRARGSDEWDLSSCSLVGPPGPTVCNTTMGF